MQNMHGGWNPSSDPHNEHHTRIHFTLFGPTGTNGLVGNQKRMDADMKALLEWKRAMDQYLITARWIAMGIGFILAFKAPPEFWSAVNSVVGVAKLFAG